MLGKHVKKVALKIGFFIMRDLGFIFEMYSNQYYVNSMKVYLALSYKECKYITQINLPRLSCQKRSKEKNPSTVENPSFVKSSKSLSSTPYRL